MHIHNVFFVCESSGDIYLSCMYVLCKEESMQYNAMHDTQWMIGQTDRQTHLASSVVLNNKKKKKILTQM